MTGECSVQTSGRRVSFEALSDGNDRTKLTLNDGNWFALQWDAGSSAQGIYLVWESLPEEYLIEQRGFDGATISTAAFFGGLTQEYMPLESDCGMLLLLTHGKGILKDVCLCRADTELPERVHNWLPPVERADLMLVAAAPGDESAVFHGLLEEYDVRQGLSCLLVYISRGSDTDINAALDALWTAGVRNLPVTGDYVPAGSAILAELEGEDYDESYATAFMIEQIRHYRPCVLATHAEGGEDGAAIRSETYRAVRQAAALSDDESMFANSAAEYGLWKTSKLYFHDYGDAASYVNVDGVDYGLFSSTVGEDGALSDLFENISETELAGYVAPEATATPYASPTPQPASKPTPTPAPDSVQVRRWAGRAWIVLGALLAVIIALVAVLVVRAVREWRKTGVQIWKKKRGRDGEEPHEHDS